MSATIEAAIRSGKSSRRLEMAIERAYGAFTFDGVSEQQLAKAAHLVRRAHEAIRNSSAATDATYLDCARVLHVGLPSALRRRVALESVVDVVRELRREEDNWKAVVDATMWLVGWSDVSRARAAHAIRLALEEYPGGIVDEE